MLNPQFSTLGAMLRDRKQRYADKAALRFGDRETSYRELDDLADAVARALAHGGILPGQRVGWLGKNSDIYYALWFGAARAGVVMVPINWRLAPAEMDWILADAGVRILFLGPERADEAEEFEKRLTTLDRCVVVDGAGPSHTMDRFLAAPPGEWELPAESPGDIALQLYTSGTTGHPKGALLSHEALLYFRTLPAAQQPQWNRWTEDDVSLIAMPQFHIGGSGFGLQTLCSGATGLVVREFDAGEVLDFISKAGLSKIFIVPAALLMLQRNAKAAEVDYSRIRTIAYGASPIPLEQLRDAMALFRCGFVQQYGMTESAGTICALPPEDHDAHGNDRMRSAGKALPWCEISILDEAGIPLPSGMIGEIALRGPTMMKGYWNRPEETAASFTADGWFRTGDAGLLDDDGYLVISDRVKDMIVSGGENIYPAEVEKALADHPAIVEAAVIGIPSERWGEAVHAIVVPVDDTFDEGTLRAWLRDRIAGYKIPKTIDVAPSLPRNPSGKVLRRELREPFWAGRDRKIN